MRIRIAVATLLAGGFASAASARDILVCNYVGSPQAQTKPHEIAPGTILRCMDKELKEVPNSLAGFYAAGYRLISAVSFESDVDGKKAVVVQYYLEK